MIVPELGFILEAAGRILTQDPDPVVRFLLLRDVLRRPPDSPEVVEARRELLKSCQVQQLEVEQRSDGSWGRLHSRDVSTKQKIHTTEAGVERALTLGLEADHPVLRKASQYLTHVLDGTIQCRDKPEKNDRWSVGVQLFAASTLAWIHPNLPVLDGVWNLWLKIARHTFASGQYDSDAEIQAHRELTGATVKNSYLVIGNKYTLILLGSRATALPVELEAALLKWIWHRNSGIGYLNVPLFRLPLARKPRFLDRWQSSLNMLSRFPSWCIVAQDAIQWIVQQRTPQGFWDLGTGVRSATMPLSANWRGKASRQCDWTTRVLVMLRKCVDGHSQVG
jgi:hypothetical protein